MNKRVLLSIMLATTSGLIAITDADAKKQGAEILNNLTNAHRIVASVDDTYKTTPDLYMWKSAISKMKTFVTTIINENKSFGMKDSTLVSALDKITKAEKDLVSNIEVSSLQFPVSLQKKTAILNQIATDMRQLQNSLQSKSMSPGAKNEARLLLAKTAFFITAMATKVANDVKKND